MIWKEAKKQNCKLDAQSKSGLKNNWTKNKSQKWRKKKS